MDDYNFNNLIEDLEMGHEIEFKHDGNSYAILYSDKLWQIYKNRKIQFSCEFENREKLINFISNFKISGMTTKEFFNSEIDIEDFYIF